MDPVTGSAVTALVGLGVHVLGVVRQELRLRWLARQERERGRYVTALALALPRGGRLDEVRGDGSEVHLVIPDPVSEGGTVSGNVARG
ncbi:hypothetical protein OK074_5450 [Actinobacteria bacterium OK074]|nr:hypothetical protein OK074_5450 [Actinobacteria bacterium OK074]